MVEAKHEFIDDNPYLVYSPDAEATASGSGGGAIEKIDFEIDNDSNYVIKVAAGELIGKIKDHAVFFVCENSDDEPVKLTQGFVIGYGPGSDAGSFVFAVLVTSYNADKYEVACWSFTAADANSNPIY